MNMNQRSNGYILKNSKSFQGEKEHVLVVRENTMTFHSASHLTNTNEHIMCQVGDIRMPKARHVSLNLVCEKRTE